MAESNRDKEELMNNINILTQENETYKKLINEMKGTAGSRRRGAK